MQWFFAAMPWSRSMMQLNPRTSHWFSHSAIVSPSHQLVIYGTQWCVPSHVLYAMHLVAISFLSIGCVRFRSIGDANNAIIRSIVLFWIRKCIVYTYVYTYGQSQTANWVCQSLFLIFILISLTCCYFHSDNITAIDVDVWLVYYQFDILPTANLWRLQHLWRFMLFLFMITMETKNMIDHVFFCSPNVIWALLVR